MITDLHFSMDIRNAVHTGRTYLQDLLDHYAPQLRYDAQENYFADSARTVVDNYFCDSGGVCRRNVLWAGGQIKATSDPAAPPRLSLDYLGDPVYPDGSPTSEDDNLDEAETHLEDAQRLHASATYRNKIYGRVVEQPFGTYWLQYLFFYYYNDLNVAGIGLHEGDWEHITIKLNAIFQPELVIFGQHEVSEQCPWGQIEKATDLVTSPHKPVVYVARASHASYVTPGSHVRGVGLPLPGLIGDLLPDGVPDDSANGDGSRVVPAIENFVDNSTPWMRWQGLWGDERAGGLRDAAGLATNSPKSPGRQGWWDPVADLAKARPCGTPEPPVNESARTSSDSVNPSTLDVPEPDVVAERRGDRAVVRYRFNFFPDTIETKPIALLVTLASGVGAASTYQVPVEAAAGEAVLDPVLQQGQYRILVSALAVSGARSELRRLTLP